MATGATTKQWQWWWKGSMIIQCDNRNLHWPKRRIAVKEKHATNVFGQLTSINRWKVKDTPRWLREGTESMYVSFHTTVWASFRRGTRETMNEECKRIFCQTLMIVWRNTSSTWGVVCHVDVPTRMSWCVVVRPVPINVQKVPLWPVQSTFDVMVLGPKVYLELAQLLYSIQPNTQPNPIWRRSSVLAQPREVFTYLPNDCLQLPTFCTSRKCDTMVVRCSILYSIRVA